MIPGAKKTNKEQLEKEQLQLQGDKVFTQGFLYSGWRSQKFAPEECFNQVTFFHEQESDQGKLLNDCLTHAVNFALRFPYFVRREQVQRLVQLRLKYSVETSSNLKKCGGVPITVFNDFLLKDGHAYSVSLLDEFDCKRGEGGKKLQMQVLKHMILQEDMKDELIFLGIGIHDGPFTHTGAFIKLAAAERQNDKIGYCDASY